MFRNFSSMDNFCGSIFWNNSLTWDTDRPEFTPCFQKTVLVWIPCLYLWMATLVEIYHISSSRERNIPWNKLNFSKATGTVVLALLQLCNIFIIFSKEDIIYEADYYDPVIKLLTFILSGTLVNYNRKYGIRTSGVLFIFWALLITAGVSQLHSQIIHYTAEPKHRYYFASYIFYYSLLVLMFVLSCFADLPPKDSPYMYSEKQSPELNSGFLIRLTFSWFDPLVWTGYKRSLTNEDIWPLNPDMSSKQNVATFEKNWQRVAKKQESKSKSSNSVGYSAKDTEKRKPISILPVLLRSFGAQFMFAMFLKLINDLLNFVQPLLLKQLIGFVESEEHMWKGYMYVMGMFTCTLVKTALLGQHFIKAGIVSVQIKNALNNAVYKKVLTISNAARKESTAGEITNLMSTDISRFGHLTFFNMVWSAPMQISLALYFLWGVLGPSVLAGVAVIVILMPINGLIARLEESIQSKMMKYKDERIKLMTEVLNGMKVLKMYAWEPSFQTQILKIRSKELNMLKRLTYFNSMSSFLFFITPFLVSLMSFACFVLVNDTEVLDSKRAFVALSLFNILRFPMFMLPNVISDIVQLHVSIKRLNKFLNADDLDTTAVEHDPKEFDQIVIENGNFTWGGEDAFLRNVNLRVPQGFLVAVVGAVGSGKSSLLSALLGEMNKISGRVNVKGNVAYVAQQAWIQNATIQDNILFGETLVSSNYYKLIDACALTADLNVFPAGDQTEIGEKGINLSGGQKQRVSLARAVYYDADNYYLDDPLSAVDSHVGKHIFDKVIGPSGLLKNKTRVWVTHNVSYLAQTDLVVVLRDGEVSEAGSYQQLLEKKGAFAEFLLHHLNEAERTSPGELDEIKQELENKLGSEFQDKLQRARSLSESASETDQAGGEHSNSVKRKTPDTQNEVKEKTKLIEAEKTETGSVKWSVYKHYLVSVGIISSVLTIVMNLILQVFQVGSNYWLTEWANDKDMLVNGTVDKHRRDMYLGVYGALGIGQVVSVSVSSLALYLGTLAAAGALHGALLSGVLRAPPVGFFDCTPVGRVLNRFSKDVDVLDNVLPMTLRGWTSCFFSVLGTLFVISYSTPIFMSVILPIGVVYYVIQRFYVSTSRQLKRLESVSRSPIYSHFGESITGAPTIRAYGVSERFIDESERGVDHNQSCYYPSCIANRWLAVRLETIGNLIIFSSALFAVRNRDVISPGIVGLSVSYALQITQTLNWLVRMTSEVETNIVAVERIKEYAETEQEAAWAVTPAPRASWPESGALQLERLTLAYRSGEAALRDVTCTVAPRDKLGIVGRTGAGKSTLTLGLFRILEPSAGRILVDGLDVTAVGLHQLRQRITLIPQDPVLFSGTLRSNLDPFEQHSDEEVYRALKHAHLMPFLEGLAAGLRHEVAEGGENLSVGQRQLVCLARALLRKTPLLVLDEATAAVDLETDELIQKTIRSEFASCTVLTIAHRLNTIMDSTKVMVLDKGQLVEYAPPQQLLQDKNSIFYSMAKDAGLVN